MWINAVPQTMGDIQITKRTALLFIFLFVADARSTEEDHRIDYQIPKHHQCGKYLSLCHCLPLSTQMSLLHHPKEFLLSLLREINRAALTEEEGASAGVLG